MNEQRPQDRRTKILHNKQELDKLDSGVSATVLQFPISTFRCKAWSRHWIKTLSNSAVYDASEFIPLNKETLVLTSNAPESVFPFCSMTLNLDKEVRFKSGCVVSAKNSRLLNAEHNCFGKGLLEFDLHSCPNEHKTAAVHRTVQTSGFKTFIVE